MSLVTLPYELLCLIIAQLDDKDLAKLLSLNKFLFDLRNSKRLWRLKYMYTFGSDSIRYGSYQAQYQVDKLLQPLREKGEDDLRLLWADLEKAKNPTFGACVITHFINIAYLSHLTIRINRDRSSSYNSKQGEKYSIVSDVIVSVSITSTSSPRCYIFESTRSPYHLYNSFPQERTYDVGCTQSYLSIENLERYLACTHAYGGIVFGEGYLDTKDRRKLKYFNVIY